MRNAKKIKEVRNKDKEDNILNLTLTKLKDTCRSHSLSVSGAKIVLILRIAPHIKALSITINKEDYFEVVQEVETDLIN